MWIGPKKPFEPPDRVALPEVAALEFPVLDIEYAVDPLVIMDIELPEPPSFKPKRNIFIRVLNALASPFRSGD